jgi:hypothetical protein
LDDGGGQVHPPAHVLDLPAGQLGHVLRLILLSFPELVAVNSSRGARPRIGGMVDDIASLELALIAGLLEDKILGEVGSVVPDVETGQEDASASASSPSQKTPIFLISSGESGSEEQGSHQFMFHAYSRKTALMSSRFTCSEKRAL